MTKAASRPIAILKLPEYEVPRLVTDATAIVRATTHNPWFPSPLPPLATVQAAIDDLAEAEVTAGTRAKGTAAARDGKRLALVGLLQQLRAYVQSIADANLESAVSIIESASMVVKTLGGPPPRVFTVKPGDGSGSAKLSAPKAANRAGYEWAYSIDGGATWVVLPFTVNASTRISGLTPGTTVLFRYRAVTKNGEGDWSQPVSMLVM